MFQHGNSWFGLKGILSYTDDNVLEFKPISSMNNELIWKGDSISRQRFTGGRLCAVRRREVQVWISCRAHTMSYVPPLLSLWLQPSGQKGEKENLSQVCSIGDLCEPLSLGVFNSEQKGRLGFPGSRGVVVNMTPGNITH